MPWISSSTTGDDGDEVTLVTVGKRGRDFMVRYGVPLVAEFSGLTDKPTILDVAPIVRVLIDEDTRRRSSRACTWPTASLSPR